MKSNRESGKIGLLTLAVIVIVGMIFVSFLFAKEDAASVGSQFMDALARHDVDKLTELSLVGKTDPSTAEAERTKLKEQWKFCVNTAGQHYAFQWKISGSNNATDDHATVIVQINKGGANGYDEKYELPMEKVSNKWLVDVRGIAKTMFPGLPE
jgi:hypothetical protein